MIRIALTQGQSAIIDDEDYERILRSRWYARYSKFTKSFHAVRTGNKSDGAMRNKTIMMAREVMRTQAGETCKHVSSDTMDNRKANLVNYVKGEGFGTKCEKIESLYIGVELKESKKGNVWKAFIDTKDSKKHLGEFVSEIDAALRRDEAMFKLYGSFAPLNFSCNLDLHKFIYRNKL